MIQENRDPANCAGTTEIQGHEIADGDHHSVAPGEAVRLDEFNFAEIVKGLPAKARMVLSAAMNLPRGSLRVRMPDGRAVLVGGKGPGPDAELVLKNWRLPGRAFSGGTIGVAESYMDGDW